MELLKGFLPLLIVLAVYLIMRHPTLKSVLSSAVGIKARIVIGCLGAGGLLALALQSGDTRRIILTILIAALVVYGAVSLQNKYLHIKK